LIITRPPLFSPLFPYTTLFRSGVAVGLRQHPHVRQAERIAVTIADAALVLRVVVLEERHGLVGGHQAPCCWRELVPGGTVGVQRSEEHTSELQSRGHLVCRLLL